jgi:hypothetical protein
MCEEKPGPRCSSDTLKTLRKSYLACVEQQQATTKIFKEWLEVEETGDSMISDFGHYQEYQAARDSFERLTQELSVANKAYDSTPEGLKSIQKLLDVSGDAVTVKNVQYAEHFEDFDTAQDEKEVNVKIPIRVFLKNKLTIAKEQRAWQTKTLAGLKKAEEVSPSKALFVAQELNKSLVKEKQDLQDKYAAKRNEYSAHAYNLTIEVEPTSIGKAKIAKNIVEREAIESRIEYIGMRLDDLSSYESKIAARSKDEIKTIFPHVFA